MRAEEARAAGDENAFAGEGHGGLRRVGYQNTAFLCHCRRLRHRLHRALRGAEPLVDIRAGAAGDDRLAIGTGGGVRLARFGDLCTLVENADEMAAAILTGGEIAEGLVKNGLSILGTPGRRFWERLFSGKGVFLRSIFLR